MMVAATETNDYSCYSSLALRVGTDVFGLRCCGTLWTTWITWLIVLGLLSSVFYVFNFCSYSARVLDLERPVFIVDLRT